MRNFKNISEREFNIRSAQKQVENAADVPTSIIVPVKRVRSSFIEVTAEEACMEVGTRREQPVKNDVLQTRTDGVGGGTMDDGSSRHDSPGAA